MSEPVRLQKFLSQAGVASRRAAEKLIVEGRVSVNGETVTELGTKVDAQRDRVQVDGRVVRAATPVWLALYKPVGYVSTRSDPEGRPTIYDLVPETFSGLFHVGRLDVASEGLILLTNEGEIANQLLHPRYEVDRVYDVEVSGLVSSEEVSRLLSGVKLEDGLAKAEHVEVRSTPRSRRTKLRVTLREGRNREVRRMFEALGHRVARLTRVRYGPIELVKLAPGEWRKLTRDERSALESGRMEAPAADKRKTPQRAARGASRAPRRRQRND